jgi:hypothetical protein
LCGFQVEADGLPRADAAFLDDVRLIELHHAGFGTDHQQVRGGD